MGFASGAVLGSGPLRVIGWVATFAALLCVSASVVAGDKADDAAKAKNQARLAALQGTVDAWLETRKGLVDPCSSCRATGQIVRGRFDRITCPSCKGKKLYIWPKRWQRLRYDVLSPDKRLTLKLPEIQAARDAADPTSSDTGYLKSARLQRVELVGEHFGRAFAFEGRDTVPRESRWIETLDPAAKKLAWFVYSEDTDGPWDESVAAAPAAAPQAPAAEPAKVEPLKSEELSAIRGKVALCETKLSLEDATKEGGTLVLSFSDPKASDATALELDADRALVALTTAAFEAMKEATAVRLVVMARWRDAFGEVRKRPFRTAEISRDTFSKIRFDRLQRQEALSHFKIASPTYEGEILWWKE